MSNVTSVDSMDSFKKFVCAITLAATLVSSNVGWFYWRYICPNNPKCLEKKQDFHLEMINTYGLTIQVLDAIEQDGRIRVRTYVVWGIPTDYKKANIGVVPKTVFALRVFPMGGVNGVYDYILPKNKQKYNGKLLDYLEGYNISPALTNLQPFQMYSDSSTKRIVYVPHDLYRKLQKETGNLHIE